MIGALRKSNQLIKMSSVVKNISRASSSATNPQNLPFLPVPKLNDTLKTFLDTAEPHLSLNSFENTKNIVREFGKSGGEQAFMRLCK
jgi:Choline/Carnitine o-acyltransferase